MTYLADNPADADYFYLIAVLTGWTKNAATTASVAMYLIGEEGTSATHVLEDKYVELFQIGSEDWFVVAEKASLGKLKSLVVWHNCSGDIPTWWVLKYATRDLVA